MAKETCEYKPTTFILKLKKIICVGNFHFFAHKTYLFAGFVGCEVSKSEGL
jgi:hypothetical protein